ncbi:MAG: hypothetical protein ACFNYI_06095, partial [Eubacterium sp.]
MRRILPEKINLEELSDEQLAALSQMNIARSRQAEEILLRRYKDLVRRVSQRYFIEGADKEDVIQE